ncbi:hypothetical protein [Pseudogemmobacter faecipullorum]|uniref:Uncharacterized protein n=1 Tax=Pseudogemmobacter faecipullorum TaxID=2755041 RepID=A0ABS8CQR8_9RHOB|nr:hypothetical protein [Pseudogemmobacter faecipullorum]MCB5411745.1 hypothetical protein [Pseudogemmobacter faecipullorum]
MARKIYHYCDIAGMSENEGPNADDPCFYAHDGSTCTIIRLEGVSTIMSSNEGIERCSRVLRDISSSLRAKGRAITVTFERSYNIAEDVERLIAPLEDAARRKGLSIQAAVNETEGVLYSSVAREVILIAVWTYRDAAEPSAYREDKRIRMSTTGKLITSRAIQDPNGPYESLQANHKGFVKQVLATLAANQFDARVLGVKDGGREDLTEVRRSILYHETPENWSPKPAGFASYPTAKKKVSSDVSTLFNEPIDRQMLTSAASSSNDLRTVTVGGRNYAVLQMSAFPQRMVSFHALLRNINGSTNMTDPMPFRVAFHMEGGAKVNGIKHTLATIGSLFSNTNRQIKHASDGILDEMRNDSRTYVYTRIYATTWTEPHEDASLLAERRSRLTRAFNSWQSPTIKDSTSDPMRLLVETCPGMVAVARTGNPAIAPAHEMGYAMPFHIESPIEREGETIYTTLDGQPMPFKAHSPMQDSWFGLIFASPGSGKSMLLNSLNMDFAAYYPSSLIPYIGILDVGESSYGFIETIQAALPLDRRHEVAFVKLRNEEQARGYRINPFDIGLGRRLPLQREKAFVTNFLLAACSELEGREGMMALIETLVTALYDRYSDIGISSGQKIYQTDMDREIDEAIDRFGIRTHENLSWYAVTDQLMKLGQVDLAIRAQRYAMPVLNDCLTALSQPEFERAHGTDLCRAVRTQITSIINAFPAFSGPTELDIGSARVVSLDLKNVIIMSPSSGADFRNNLLFFMMARELFMKKISGDVDEVGHMAVPTGEMGEIYRKYWRQRVAEVSQTRKRFCFDEFHITGSSPIMANQIDQDVRQGRKWGLEVLLVSQRLDDFAKYTEFAANLFILKVATRTEQENLQKIFKADDAVVEQAMEHCTGPVPGQGATILIRRSFQGRQSWLLARNRLGPVRIWALTTTMEDRALKKALTEICGDFSSALEILASRFPNGSAKRYWDRVAPSIPSSQDVATEIARTLYNEHNP